MGTIAVGRTLRWSLLAGGIAIATTAAATAPARAQADLEAAFRLLDENGDGVVTRDQFQRNKTQIFFVALDAAGADQSLGPEDIALTQEVFAQADIDGDGRLSGAEFVQAPFTQFEAFDANSSGEITLEEFLAAASSFVVG